MLVQPLLLVMALAAVPVMLVCKPLILKKRHEARHTIAVRNLTLRLHCRRSSGLVPSLCELGHALLSEYLFHCGHKVILEGYDTEAPSHVGGAWALTKASLPLRRVQGATYGRLHDESDPETPVAAGDGGEDGGHAAADGHGEHGEALQTRLSRRSNVYGHREPRIL